MAKKAKNKPLKMPKRLLGAKLPKDARRTLNRLLKLAPADAAKPLITAAVGGIAVALAERLEQPLKDLLEGHWPATKAPPRRKHVTQQSPATH